MAVDYLHRLIITGPDRPLRTLRRQLHYGYPRTVSTAAWTEIVSFSFEALYKLAPKAHRVEPEIPYDPYDLRAWPVRRLTAGTSELRYQFHTRNLEMQGLLRALSRVVPSLSFVMVTMCIDDGDIWTYRIRRGTWRKWSIPHKVQEFYWSLARKKFGLEGDDVYDNDEAEVWTEEELLELAHRHWQDRKARNRKTGGRRREWWNQVVIRDLKTEREIAFIEVSESSAG
jgi:hypothetical protein